MFFHSYSNFLQINTYWGVLGTEKSMWTYYNTSFLLKEMTIIFWLYWKNSVQFPYHYKLILNIKYRDIFFYILETQYTSFIYVLMQILIEKC